MTLSITHAHAAAGTNDPTKEVSKDRWNEGHTITGIGAGSSFPVSPTTGDQFFRTDLGLDCYYDGVRWLSKQEYEIGSGLNEGSQSFASTTPFIPWRAPVRSDYSLYMTRWVVTSRVNTTNTGSVYWTMELFRQAGDTTGTSLASFNTSADSPGTIVQHDQVLNVVLDSSAKNLFANATKTGSPGAMHLISAAYYRLIVT